MWIGTMDGLNRFDGNRIKIYKSFYANDSTAATIKIAQLVADQKGHLWVGTDNGLYLYDEQSDSFHVFYHETHAGLVANNIKTLYSDQSGNIWIGTGDGLSKAHLTAKNQVVFETVPLSVLGKAYDKCAVQAVFEDKEKRVWVGTNKGVLLLSDKDNIRFANIREQLEGQGIASFAQDWLGQIWIGTFLSGVYVVNELTGTAQHFKEEKEQTATLVSNTIRKIVVDHKGRVWIGTLKGLTVFDPVRKVFDNYTHVPEDANTLNYNSIYDIFEDGQGNVWVGTYFGGANIAEAVTTRFKVFKNEANTNSISSNVISSIVSDSCHNLWIGTEAEGLNYYDRKANKFYRYKNDEANPASLRSNLVKIILRDKENNIWIGLHNGILEKISKDYKSFVHCVVGNEASISRSEDITTLVEDDRGILWAGKAGAGLYISDLQKKRFKNFEETYPNQKLSNEFITCLFLDSRKNIWIGTKGGLNVFEASDNSLKTVYRKSRQGKFQADNINCITEDKKGIIWFGTYAGLCSYNPFTREITTLTSADGLAGDKVIGIIVDDDSSLWISTNKGLCRLDVVKHTFNTYSKLDGLPTDVYNNNSFYKDDNGHLFFGSFSGFVEFAPTEIGVNHVAPAVTLTGLLVNGKYVAPGDSTGILSQNITSVKQVQLAYDQNMLTVQYAVLSYIKPGKNRSAYMLQGYDKQWVTSTGHSASYTNLPPGKYTLHIKACNNDGVWNEEAVYLTIIVHPPFWKTWWAYLLYALIILSAVYGALYFFNSRRDLKRKLDFEHALNLQQQELHNMKMDFFTHISHEIRTPLTLIAGPAEMLLEQSVPRTVAQKLLFSIKGNADRLLKLTNDLLAFRKADAGHTELHIQQDNIVTMSKAVFDRFTGEALHKNIQYEFHSSQDDIPVYFDKEHMEIVLSNLLSNALKFTPAGGKVSMEVKREDQQVIIKVADTGEGIAEEEQSKIFTGFYQVKRGDDKKIGSGIGLAFAKTLVELHKGEIRFESLAKQRPGKNGTVFIVSLKLGNEHLR